MPIQVRNKSRRNIPKHHPVAAAAILSFGLFFGIIFTGCAHSSVKSSSGNIDGLEPVTVAGPIELKMKSKLGAIEKVAYLHKSASKSYEDSDLRNQKDEALEFTSEADTTKASADSFTQTLTIVSKDGTADMHDFAMPELGEQLEVTADSRGRVLHAGNYPANSIFYVPPVSLPDGPVNVGDTWAMQSSWLTLDEMVPFQLDMVSILKGVYKCGSDTCAEIEIQGDVTLQGSLVQSMSFKSNWRGRMYFAIGAGTVVWSRIDSVEEMNTDRARRDVRSCLEALLVEPKELKINSSMKPTCAVQPLIKDSGTIVLPPTKTENSN